MTGDPGPQPSSPKFRSVTCKQNYWAKSVGTDLKTDFKLRGKQLELGGEARARHRQGPGFTPQQRRGIKLEIISTVNIQTQDRNKAWAPGVHKKTLELFHCPLTGAVSHSAFAAKMSSSVMRDVYLHALPLDHVLRRPQEHPVQL